jgi:hypothetical protein
MFREKNTERIKGMVVVECTSCKAFNKKAKKLIKKGYSPDRDGLAVYPDGQGYTIYRQVFIKVV